MVVELCRTVWNGDASILAWVWIIVFNSTWNFKKYWKVLRQYACFTSVEHYFPSHVCHTGQERLFCTEKTLPFLCFSFHLSSSTPFVNDPFPSRHRKCADTAVAYCCVRLVFPPEIQNSLFFIIYTLDNIHHLHVSIIELDKRSTKTICPWIFVRLFVSVYKRLEKPFFKSTILDFLN